MADFINIARKSSASNRRCNHGPRQDRSTRGAEAAEHGTEQFTQFYYKTFDENRFKLKTLYRGQSMLTFETTALRGADAIAEKLATLPFEKVVHKVATLDAQPSNDSGGILVMVTGALLVDEEQQPMSYSQVFQLVQDAGSYFVLNDIFKLVYPH
ncbi:Nuclear transport factor 2 [Sticta canariensis]|nr:Nuclear transport factor 2 [Sticta canariensis]